jgi:hypothetical protein
MQTSYNFCPLNLCVEMPLVGCLLPPSSSSPLHQRTLLGTLHSQTLHWEEDKGKGWYWVAGSGVHFIPLPCFDQNPNSVSRYRSCVLVTVSLDLLTCTVCSGPPETRSCVEDTLLLAFPPVPSTWHGREGRG